MENLRVRKYETKDFGIALNFDGNPTKRREQKLRMLELKNVFYGYVAESDKGMEGFIIMDDMGDGKSHCVVQVQVKEERKGVGRSLMAKVLSDIESGGHVSLAVNIDNKSAIKFYEAMGFTKSGHTQEYKKGRDYFWYQIDV